MEGPWAEASAEGEKVQTLGSRRGLRGGPTSGGSDTEVKRKK